MTALFDLKHATPLTVEMARDVVAAAIQAGRTEGSGVPLYREATLASWQLLSEQARPDFYDLIAELPYDDRSTLRQALRDARVRGTVVPPAGAGAFRVRALAELLVRRSGGYWIKGLFPRPGLGLVYGASGCGKTFLMGHAALSAAAGLPFFGRRVAAGPVAYIAAENPASVELRFAAWRDRIGVTTPNLFVVDGPVCLPDSAAMEALLERLRDLAMAVGGFGALIVDTAAAAAPGMDENASADMGRLIAGCAQLRDEFGAAVILVHHGGKDATRGARGHSSLRAAVDAELEVELLTGGGRRARITKSRDGATGEEIFFDLETLEIGTDDDGDPLTTCRVVESSIAMQARGAPDTSRLSATVTLALEALREVVQHQGERSAGTSVIPAGAMVVPLDDWRDRFRARRGRLSDELDARARQKEMNASKTAFLRCVDELQKRHIAGVYESRAWLC